MELRDEARSSTDSRDGLLDNLRDALEDLDWRNLQLADRILAPYQLTLPQLAVLTILDRIGPNVEMSRIATRTGLPPSTITSIMDRLLLRRFVERRHHPDDRRRVTGSITDDGRAVVEELREQRRKIITDLLGSLSDDELRVLWHLVDRWLSFSEDQLSQVDDHA
ncbi:MAG TPA: MarR family transcriptional regulator [Thermomicrobiales bacterium]|jgi:DNA-binding MarR family transcriptional regulator|nr:MarR family transcriptional regulator [Thermomicrobiales bacterium]